MNVEAVQKKPQNNKRVYILAGITAFLACGLVILVVSTSSSSSQPAVNTPVKNSGTVNSVKADSNLSSLTKVDTNASVIVPDDILNKDLDQYFISVEHKKQTELPVDNKMPANGMLPTNTNGVAVKLPNLKNPAELVHVKTPIMTNVSSGIPTQIPVQITAMENIRIMGIACDGGECRATTSIGDLFKGSKFGGGNYVNEKVESITMTGITTDKRFISY